MSINQTEATRLARICLPQILAHSRAGIEDEIIEIDGASKLLSQTLSKGDVTVKSQCRLWAGMGYIYQVTIAIPSLSSSKHNSKSKTHHKFIIKHIVIPPPPRHSRRSIGDERKAYSYWIEANFYQSLAPTLIEKYDLAIPIPYHIELEGFEVGDDGNYNTEVVKKEQTITICMSLLNGSPSKGSMDDNIHAALSWLATLHAATWGAKVATYVEKKAVQPIGSYWHLDTRPDEHEAMPNRGWEGRLKLAARAIHERLRRDRMQCCIHGDAKDANMMFFERIGGNGGCGGVSVSMYDFQYCGRAPPSVSMLGYNHSSFCSFLVSI